MLIEKVMVLGNSITAHAPKADIGWLDNWGMAASSMEKDFAHLLLDAVACRNQGRRAEAVIKNIAAFEREYSTYDIKVALSAYADFKPDIVVLAIGENIPPPDTPGKMEALKSALAILLAILEENGHPALFIRSCFYADPVKDGILREMADRFNATFVDISALCRDENNFARSERSFENRFVAAHPGDRGMAAIASAIWEQINKTLN